MFAMINTIYLQKLQRIIQKNQESLETQQYKYNE